MSAALVAISEDPALNPQARLILSAIGSIRVMLEEVGAPVTAEQERHLNAATDEVRTWDA